MRPLKIAFLSQFYWRESRFHYDEEGGVTRQLAEAVAALGHEVIVLSQSPDVRRLKRISLGSLEVWVSPREKKRGLFSAVRDRLVAKSWAHPQAHSDALALRDFLTKRGPFDALWAHAESPDGMIAAYAAQIGVKLPPLVLQVQGLRTRYDKVGAPVFVDKKPLSLAFSLAKRILAVSELIADNIPKYAGPGSTGDELKAKTQIVYPNLQRAFLRIAEDRVQLPGPMKDRILYLGALNLHKGALVFLKALPKTELSRRSSSIAVIGDFTDYDRNFIKRWEDGREEARRLITGARMEYLGRVTADEVIRQIKLARAVIIPSLFDAYARGLVESLILGRPVVTTDQVGSSPLVRAHECGLIVAPNDPDALARAIDAVISPIIPFADKAQNLSHRLVHEFSPESIAKQIEKHLLEVAGN